MPGMSAYLAARLAGDPRAAALLPRQVTVNAANPGRNSGWHGDGDEDDDGNHSTVTVRISTAIRVSGGGNIISIPTNPAESARLVAETVTRTIGQSEAAENGGIPMIDEEGRPRPLRIEIEAGIEVNGEGNVMGGEDVVMKAVLGKRRRAEESGEEASDEGRRRYPSQNTMARASTST
ncbi:hypothetical protein M406DRAFT_327620 [Cryphonectria parasitica EP155]|uniref:Uncharacterized protein n=1 Tax=Cryphonectria parasitica (strain ATCC 38755 / EP155) TaxID=660469 RepID=A0A9P4YA57_CRYP1|nr:uncharacterized protein M406DRAFT_327620 [Cryphonectria parasitica EP155]KAF3769229.1 hypothetical protein M406DRAFT_327620 [Cryphonectria parasitica EP155]